MSRRRRGAGRPGGRSARKRRAAVREDDSDRVGGEGRDGRTAGEDDGDGLPLPDAKRQRMADDGGEDGGGEEDGDMGGDGKEAECSRDGDSSAPKDGGRADGVATEPSDRRRGDSDQRGRGPRGGGNEDRERRARAGGKFRCEACDVVCGSEVDFEQHLMGRNHRRMVGETGEKIDRSVGRGNASEFYCALCDVSCGSEKEYRRHLSGRRHCRRAGEENICLPADGSDLRGGGRRRNQAKFYCATCNVSCGSEVDWRAHLNGKMHRSRDHGREMQDPAETRSRAGGEPQRKAIAVRWTPPENQQSSENPQDDSGERRPPSPRATSAEGAEGTESKDGTAETKSPETKAETKTSVANGEAAPGMKDSRTEARSNGASGTPIKWEPPQRKPEDGTPKRKESEGGWLRDVVGTGSALRDAPPLPSREAKSPGKAAGRGLSRESRGTSHRDRARRGEGEKPRGRTARAERVDAASDEKAKENLYADSSVVRHGSASARSLEGEGSWRTVISEVDEYGRRVQVANRQIFAEDEGHAEDQLSSRSTRSDSIIFSRRGEAIVKIALLAESRERRGQGSGRRGHRGVCALAVDPDTLYWLRCTKEECGMKSNMSAMKMEYSWCREKTTRAIGLLSVCAKISSESASKIVPVAKSCGMKPGRCDGRLTLAEGLRVSGRDRGRFESRLAALRALREALRAEPSVEIKTLTTEPIPGEEGIALIVGELSLAGRPRNAIGNLLSNPASFVLPQFLPRLVLGGCRREEAEDVIARASILLMGLVLAVEGRSLLVMSPSPSLGGLGGAMADAAEDAGRLNAALEGGMGGAVLANSVNMHGKPAKAQAPISLSKKTDSISYRKDDGGAVGKNTNEGSNTSGASAPSLCDVGERKSSGIGRDSSKTQSNSSSGPSSLAGGGRDRPTSYSAGREPNPSPKAQSGMMNTSNKALRCDSSFPRKSPAGLGRGRGTHLNKPAWMTRQEPTLPKSAPSVPSGDVGQSRANPACPTSRRPNPESVTRGRGDGPAEPAQTASRDWPLSRGLNIHPGGSDSSRNHGPRTAEGFGPGRGRGTHMNKPAWMTHQDQEQSAGRPPEAGPGGLGRGRGNHLNRPAWMTRR